MAVREIKTTLAVDGEKAFNKAVTEAGRNMRVMASEMKAAAADFNLTGDEMDYLGRKSQSLKGQIDQQEAIIRALEGAVADAAKEYGEASAKTDGYRIKLNNAQASMAKLKKELEDTNREMTDMGRDAGRVGRQLEAGIGEAAEEVTQKFDQMANKLDRDISDISSTLNFRTAMDVGGAIADGVQDAYGAVAGLVDASMDYNRTISFLQVNAEAAGHSFETIKGYATDVAGITGDMDAAVEGMSNLLKSGFEADEMALAVKRLSGAIIQFPDTMKFESLADSLQESIATGSAVGQYAEYLERTGQDLEIVNKALENAKKNSQEAVETAALAMLSGNGAEEVLEKWKTDNSEMVEYYTAQAQLTDAQANLAKELTPLATSSIELATTFFNSAAEATKEVKALFETWKTMDKEAPERREKVESNTDYNAVAQKIDEEYKKLQEVGNRIGSEAANKLMLDLDTAKLEYALGNWDEATFNKELERIGKEAGLTFTQNVGLSAEENAESLQQSLETIGKGLPISMGNGIELNEHYAVSSIQNLMASMQAEADKGVTIPIYTKQETAGKSKYGTSPGAGGFSVTMDLDGRTLGRATAEYNADSIGAAVERYELYG